MGPNPDPPGSVVANVQKLGLLLFYDLPERPSAGSGVVDVQKLRALATLMELADESSEVVSR